MAGPVLGWTSAIAAYGAFLIAKIFATQMYALKQPMFGFFQIPSSSFAFT
jgi:NNP family nitrate/nitrite transporter-like MFS transporter